MKKILLLLSIILLFSSLVYATPIDINSIKSTQTKPGEFSSIEIILENHDNKDISDVVVSLDLDSLPFVPVGSSNKKVIYEIGEDEIKKVRFNLFVFSDAKSRTYFIPLKIGYGNLEESTVIDVKVVSEPILDVLIKNQEVFEIGEEEITIKFVNNGLSDIKFLSATLIESQRYTIIPPNSFHTSNIKSGDSKEKVFTLNINDDVSFIPIKLDFLDSSNNRITKTELLDINVRKPEEVRGDPSVTLINKFSLITTLVIVSIVILLIIRYLLLATKNFRKRRKNIIYSYI